MISSIKIRLGTSIDNIRIANYLDIFERNGIKKVYIHARPLRYPYEKIARYDLLDFLNKKKYGMEIILNGDISEVGSTIQFVI